jgi:branched-chain amino acid transport system permease protein
MDPVEIVARSLGSAGIYIMIGLGYNVIFATAKVFNLAQGEFAVVAMFIGLFVVVSLGAPLFVALAAAIVLVAVLGMIEERIAVRPVMRHESGAGGHRSIAWAITTLAFAAILESSLEAIAGVNPVRFPSLLPDVTFDFLEVVFRSAAVGLFIIAVIVAISLHIFYTRSLTGKAFTAMSHDAEAATLRGIPAIRFKSASFALAGGIAAFGAFFIAPITFVYPSLGATYTFKGFIAIAIGGMGNNAGAVIGGLLLALVETVGSDIAGAGYRDTIAMAFLLVMLLLWPSGVTGRHVERFV